MHRPSTGTRPMMKFLGIPRTKDDKAMKKTIILLATALVALVACNKEIETPVSKDLVTSISAIAPDTKTTVDGLQVEWTTGDQVALFQSSGGPALFTLKGEGPVTNGTFTSSEGALNPNGLAAYPGVGATQSSTKISMQIPAEFAYGTSPIPMIGVASSLTTFGFSLCTGAIRISYTGVPEQASKFILTSDKIVSGTLEIANYADPKGAAFASDATGKSFTVTDVTAGDLTLVLPLVAGTHTLGIKLVASDGTTVIPGSDRTITNVEIVAGQIAKMAGIAISDIPAGPQIYKISKLWVWGGTGPQYGCTKLYELLYDEQFAKYAKFDNTDGRGPRALRDNYLVFNLDGTFQNWAGEDGRNWWFIYDQNGTLIDLTSFYDLLPRSAATWALNEDNLTFTLSGGTKVVTAKILPAGTYDMPNTTPLKQLTVASTTLQFTISGGTDYWDNAASDLDVFAKHPRALFFELEQMPAGFEVPAASKTIDKDFAYEPPFDIYSLPGTWNVLGGSSDTGLMVLGGSGSDPAFVSPLAKSWCWNNVAKEVDNNLTITPTGLGATITGTIKWEAGADGAFWDYTWKNTGEDLSRFYDKIPKGQSSFSLNVSSLEVTFANGNSAKILQPGTYKLTQFYNNPTLTIPAQCFGLQFHLMDPIGATPAHYTDVDRFVNAPLEYIIIFEKP